MLHKTTTPRVLVLCTLLAAACTSDAPPDPATEVPSAETAATAPVAAGTSGYLFDQPDDAFELADDLREISGLTMLADGRLGAIQDEDGILYVLDPATGAVAEEHPFGGSDDYEGVEQAGDRLFVLRSDGRLIELAAEAGGFAEVETYDTGLKSKNDTEGLGYDAANERLLVALKEDPGSGLDEDDVRAVHAFDLASGTLSDEPVLLLGREAIESQLPDRRGFKPSALAVHPLSGDVYVLSSTTRALAVFSAAGDLQDVFGLPEAMFEQPEGLAFLEDGTLFIASEGDNNPPMLYRYRPGGA